MKVRRKTPQRGRGPYLREEPVHPAVAQQVHVIDAVRPSQHADDQGGDLQVRVRPTLPVQRHVRPDQGSQPARCAKAMAGARLAHDTRFASSNLTDKAERL